MPLSTPRRPHPLFAALAASLALAAGGCDAARVPPTEPSLASLGGREVGRTAPYRAWVVAGDGQTGTVASKLPAPVVVRVVDTAKRPVAGQWVHFGPVNPAADDAVSADSARTDAAGEARVEWTLGTGAGPRGIVARVRTGPRRFVADTARAEARGGAPASVTLTASHPSGGLGTPVSSIVTAYVRDAYGNLSPGATVTWTVVEGGGSPSQPTSTVPEHGTPTVASIRWTLGTPGPQVMRATVGALSDTAGVFLPAPEGLVLAGTTRAPGPAPSSGGIFLLDPRTGRWHWVLGSDPGEFRAPAWAPSGDRVAYVEDDYVRPDLEVPATFSGSSLRTGGPGGLDPIFCACPFDTPAWSPAGTRIAARSGSGVIVYGDGAFANLGAGTLPQWSPDGARVFFLSGSELRSAAPDGSAPAAHLGGVAEARLSPGGGRVAYVPTGGSGLFVAALGGGGTPVALDGGGRQQVRWSPDGDRVLARRPDGTWVLARADGSAPAATVAVPAGSRFQDFSPDGATMVFLTAGGAIVLASVDGGVSVVTAAPGDELPPHVAELRWRPAP